MAGNPDDNTDKNGIPQVVRSLATADGRDYITPEDVTAALAVGSETDIQREVLACIGRVGGFGVEDKGLCAYVALNLERDDVE